MRQSLAGFTRASLRLPDGEPGVQVCERPFVSGCVDLTGNVAAIERSILRDNEPAGAASFVGSTRDRRSR